MNLREARIAKGWTLDKFAQEISPFVPSRKGGPQKIGSLRANISAWETGGRPAPLKVQGRIEELLGCQIDFNGQHVKTLAAKLFLSGLKLSEEDVELILKNPLLQEAAGKALAELCKKVREAVAVA